MLFDGRVSFRTEADSPDRAIEAAGRLLAADGLIEERYITAMKEELKNHGAYMVIVPGIALVHARPEEGARGDGMSIVRLKEPLVFGHAANDPVDLVFGLAAAGSDTHVQSMSAFAALLMAGEFVRQLRAAGSAGEFRKVADVFDI